MPIQFPEIPERVRAYFYRLAGAVLAALVAFDVIDGGDLPVILNVVAAVLGLAATGLAVANTSAKPADG